MQRLKALLGSRSRYTLGILALLVVILIWVASSELIQFIFDNADFNKPFFLTYFNTSLFALYLFGLLLKPEWYPDEPPSWLPWLRRWKNDKERRRHEDQVVVVDHADIAFDRVPVQANADETLLAPDQGAVVVGGGVRRGTRERNGLRVSGDEDGDVIVHDASLNGQQKLPTQEDEQPIVVMEKLRPLAVAKIALLFCPLWFGANYAFNLSLTLTTVSSNTILSTSSSLFTFFLGMAVGVEKWAFHKLAGIVVTLGGVALIALNDAKSTSEHAPHPVVGDLICVASAFFYGSYVIYLKKAIDDERRIHMPFFFGLVGLFNAVMLWPVLLILNATGAETFQLPPWRVLGFLLLNGVIGTVLSDYLWMLSVMLASPVVATVGLSLTIPLAIVADTVLHGSSFTMLYFAGGTLVIFGFILANTDRHIRWLLARVTACCRRYRSV